MNVEVNYKNWGVGLFLLLLLGIAVFKFAGSTHDPLLSLALRCLWGAIPTGIGVWMIFQRKRLIAERITTYDGFPGWLQDMHARRYRFFGLVRDVRSLYHDHRRRVVPNPRIGNYR